MSRAQDAPEDAALRRRRSARQVRHTARMHLQIMAGDGDALDDAVLPTGCHDLGRRASPKPQTARQPGRRPGFKVWKSPFWKRRRQLWATRNAAERQLIEAEE
ncbi:MAG TPA: hypothetical protein VKQ71_12470 [Acidimicrobiales bacterium]|nr:hypothetical protein [Acidimicrobiales bacterium]